MKHIKILLGILLTAILFNACLDVDNYGYNLGDNFVNSASSVYTIDTISVEMSTIMVDSVLTSNPSRLLAGVTTDLVGVKTYAESYFQLEPAEAPQFFNSAVYDSATFNLKLDGYHLGDTAQIAAFGLFRVTEVMEFEEDEIPLFYAHHEFACENEPWATFEVDFSKTINRLIDSEEKINNYRVITTTLDATVGKMLFDLAKDENSILDSSDDFIEEFKGFVIKPLDLNMNVIAGFVADADSTGVPTIEIFYHDSSDDDDLSFTYDYSYDKISTTKTATYTFNHIENDFSNSVFNDVEPGEATLSSLKTDNLTYLMAGTNVQTRFDVPGIEYLFGKGNTAILSARLVFEPIEGTFNDYFDLPNVLYLDLLNEDNSVAGNITQLDGETLTYAYLTRNDEFNKYQYSCDVSRYIKDIFDKTLEKNSVGLPEELTAIERGFSLRFASSEVSNVVDRLVLGDPRHPQNAMHLEIILIAN